MASDPSLVPADGLPHSAEEYAEWEKIIFSAALEFLRAAGNRKTQMKAKVRSPPRKHTGSLGRRGDRSQLQSEIGNPKFEIEK
jgi:hypothetical protein